MKPAGAELKGEPRLVACAFMDAGLVLSSQLPVLMRWIKVWKAAMVSADVKVQWPARCTNTWRSMLLSPALLTTLAYAFSSVTSTRPVSYTHLRAHETRHDLVCRLL